MSELYIYSDDDDEIGFNEASINNSSFDNDNISPELPEINNFDFTRYQENINNPWRQAPKEINIDMPSMPLIYYPEYDLLPNLNFSNKIIVPSKVLDEISKYEGILYPLHFKINDSEMVFTPFDFKDSIDHVYIPEKIFSNLQLNFDGIVNLTLHNTEIAKGTKIILKPHTSNFLEIHDHKSFLETILVANYTALMEGQSITVNYLDSEIDIDVIKCEPETLISIVDTDLEVDFEQPYDYVEPPPKPPTPKPVETYNPSRNMSLNFSINTPSNSTPPQTENKGFVPFSGKGHRLGDS
jgi:hypothetical protein